jgi:hypothetical protein
MITYKVLRRYRAFMNLCDNEPFFAALDMIFKGFVFSLAYELMRGRRG